MVDLALEQSQLELPEPQPSLVWPAFLVAMTTRLMSQDLWLMLRPPRPQATMPTLVRWEQSPAVQRSLGAWLASTLEMVNKVPSMGMLTLAKPRTLELGQRLSVVPLRSVALLLPLVRLVPMESKRPSMEPVMQRLVPWMVSTMPLEAHSAKPRPSQVLAAQALLGCSAITMMTMALAWLGA